MFICNTRAYYLFMLSMIESQSVLHFVSKQMFIFKTRMFYRTTVLYMLDSWCKMHHLYSILFTSLGPISFFVYGLLFPKVKIISFYQFHVLYNNFGDMNTVCQLCCFKSVFYVIHLCVFHFSECLCVCVCLCIYCCVCMNSVSMYL